MGTALSPLLPACLPTWVICSLLDPAMAHKLACTVKAVAGAYCFMLICRSIAQGCSEYNITVLIDGKDSVRALRAVHSRFYLASLPLAVGIVGPGAIGSTFIRQLMQQKEVNPEFMHHNEVNSKHSMERGIYATDKGKQNSRLSSHCQDYQEQNVLGVNTIMHGHQPL